MRVQIRPGPFLGQIESFCFSGGEAIHAEGREGRTGGTAERPDKVGARRPETLPVGCLWQTNKQTIPAGRTFPVSQKRGSTGGPGWIWAKSFGLRLDRATSTVFAESLDLGPNQLRQNVSI
jgi:hypothetical protein